MDKILRIEAITENEVVATLTPTDALILREDRIEMFRYFVSNCMNIPASNVLLRICGDGFDYHI